MAQQDETSYTLDELAEKSGFEKRVIRSFIEQGLMRGPENMGRYARYSPGHLVRLLAIKVLKEKRGLHLSEVRRALITMSIDQISSLARECTEAAEQQLAPEIPNSSALDYIRGLRQPPQQPGHGALGFTEAMKLLRGQGNAQAQEQSNLVADRSKVNDVPVAPPRSGTTQSAPQTGDSAFDQVLQELSQLNQGLRVRRQSRAESWYRIAITPDIEIAVRGIEDPDQLSRLERIADHLRDLLLRGNHA